jgi:tryptophan synthase alpha chain
MNRLDRSFADARLRKRTAFAPFVTVGDPSCDATVQVVRRLAEEAGRRDAPILFELGFPYSDPIADGAAIQASYTRALAKGLKQADIFRTIAEIRTRVAAPLVAMASYSLIHRAGVERWLERAADAGLDGAVVPDLPAEEAGETFRAASARDFKLVQLVAPTTPEDRVQKILACCSGFVYAVAVTGITGERTELPTGLAERIRWLRGMTDLPICVGFGVSKPEHVKTVAQIADGAIVGSALVKRLANVDDPARLEELVRFAGELMAELDRRS